MKYPKKENDQLVILLKDSGRELSVEQFFMALLGVRVVSQGDTPQPNIAQNQKIPKTPVYDLEYPGWRIS